MDKLAWMIRFEIQMERRDTLKCPKCYKIGTWKPRDEPKRYLCKWCGFYEDMNRLGWARPCAKQKVLMLYPLMAQKTPSQRCGNFDPLGG